MSAVGVLYSHSSPNVTLTTGRTLTMMGPTHMGEAIDNWQCRKLFQSAVMRISCLLNWAKKYLEHKSTIFDATEGEFGDCYGNTVYDNWFYIMHCVNEEMLILTSSHINSLFWLLFYKQGNSTQYKVKVHGIFRFSQWLGNKEKQTESKLNSR